MRGTIDGVLKTIMEYFRKLTRRERIRLVILVVLVIGLGIVVASLLGRTTYSILYSGLSESEAGEIYTALLGMGEDAQMQGTNTILVPEGRVSELRVTLASQGYQNSGFTYDLFDRASGFGMTDLEKQTLVKYQLQEHIRSQLKLMAKVKDCLVNLNLPKESLFALQGSGTDASASVTLVLTGGVKLTQSEVNAVAETVIDSVSGLTAENLTITDSNMNLYRVGDESDITGDVTSQLSFKQDFQAVLEEQVMNVAAPIFGVDSIRVSVNAVLNFDSMVSESVVFEPPVEGETEGLVVSAYSLREASRTDDGTGGVVGTEENGMGTEEYPYGTLEDGELYEKQILETNYELNRTTTQMKKNGYAVENLSVAIVLDSQAVADDYTQAVASLVAMAIGVDPEYISVQRLPFQNTSESIEAVLAAQEEFMKSMQIREYIEKAVTWVLVIILVVVFLLLVRSIVRSARRPVAEGVGGAVDYLASEDLLKQAGLDVDIDLSAKPENVLNLEKLIDRDAGAVAQLLRNWITDD